MSRIESKSPEPPVTATAPTADELAQMMGMAPPSPPPVDVPPEDAAPPVDTPAPEAPPPEDIPAPDTPTVTLPLPPAVPSLGDTYAANTQGRKFWFTAVVVSDLVDTANIVTRGVFANSSGLTGADYDQAFFIAPYPTFDLQRVGLDNDGFNDAQDEWALGLSNLKLGLNNAFGYHGLYNPSEVRTSDQASFGALATSYWLDAEHDKALFDGFVPNHQDGPFWRTVTSLNLAAGIVKAGSNWKMMDSLTVMNQCSPTQLSYFNGDEAACTANLDDNANGVDAYIEGNYDDPTDATDKTPDMEALEANTRVTTQLAQSGYRGAYMLGNYTLAGELEGRNGRPSWLSLGMAAPFVADIAVNSSLGHPLDIWDIGERGLLAVGAFGLQGLITDPLTETAMAKPIAYLTKSPDYPIVLESTFQSSTGNNPDSLYNLTPGLALGGYTFDTFWTGFNSGLPLTATSSQGSGFQRFLPLGVGVLGLGLQAAYSGNPDNLKYVGLGALTMGAGVGLGAWMGDSEFLQKLMLLHPQVSVGSDSVAVGITVVK